MYLSPSRFRVLTNDDQKPRTRTTTSILTADLMSLVDWLAQCGAKSVVMEATGVYWVNLYELLERTKPNIKQPKSNTCALRRQNSA
jgi:transposase